MCKRHRNANGLERREILRYGLAGLGIAALGPWARKGFAAPMMAPPAATKRLVVLNLFGGNDALNTVIPVSLGSYYSERPTLAISSGAALSLASGPHANSSYKLHPSLAGVKQIWDEGTVAIVNKVGYPDANQSHFESMDIWSTGKRDLAAGTAAEPVSGWIARYADQYAPTPMGAAAIGVEPPKDFTGGATNLFVAGGSLSSFKYNKDFQYQANFDYRQQLIKGMLANYIGLGLDRDTKNALQQGYDLEAQIQSAVSSYTSGVSYPGSSIAQNLKNVAILIKAGFDTRVFYTGFGGFDTHGSQGGQFGEHANLLNNLNGGLAAFVADLKAMGAWNDTTIVVISEFGRRNYENGSQGTDHGGAGTVLVLGGSVQGGVKGPDITDADVQDEVLDYEVDFRSIYKEVLTENMGAGDLSAVFPETQEKNGFAGVI